MTIDILPLAPSLRPGHLVAGPFTRKRQPGRIVRCRRGPIRVNVVNGLGDTFTITERRETVFQMNGKGLHRAGERHPVGRVIVRNQFVAGIRVPLNRAARAVIAGRAHVTRQVLGGQSFPGGVVYVGHRGGRGGFTDGLEDQNPR